MCKYKLKDREFLDGGIEMIHFDQDYAEGAHPKILERLIETNMKQEAGYGNDCYSENARKYIKEKCENEKIDIHFLSAGTQTNTIVIASALRPHQGVIAADTGHIQTLETGAIEAVGHKILLLPTEEGKINSKDLAELCEGYWNNEANIHKVQPAMLHIANPTEVGTLYTKEELEELRTVTKKYNLKFFIDGARLGYGFAADTNDLTMKDMVDLTDVFYIGGTKNGALLGEAVVIKDDELKRDFRSIMKQKGALLAKGRLLGIQFETLFKDQLYFEIADYAVKQAMRIKKTLIENDIPLKYENNTNQLFPIFSNAMMNHLEENFEFLIIEKEDANHQLVRICTSWASKKENVDYLIEEINNYSK